MLTTNQLNFTIIISALSLFHDCNCGPPDSTLIPIYTPHSKEQQQRAKPSIFLIESIIEFREAYNTWPISKQEFTAKKTKYKEAFIDFYYLNTQFKIKDNDNMTFYFSAYIKDEQRYEKTQRIDLNSYGGEVKFYKENDKFIWKIRMY
jgi:hypothetical protein